MGRGRTAAASTASNTASVVTANALCMQTKLSRGVEKTIEKDHLPPDESDDSSHDSGARKTRRSIQAVSKEQNVNAITQNKPTKPTNVRSRLRKSTQLNHNSSLSLVENRTQKPISHSNYNRTDELLVVSDGILMKNRIYEGIHSNHNESSVDQFADVANDENVVNVVEISDETDNLSMDTDTITTESSSMVPDSNDTTCSADDEAESSIFSEDSQTRSSSIVTVTPDDSNSMQPVEVEKRKDSESPQNVNATSCCEADKKPNKCNLEKLTGNTPEKAERAKTPEKPSPLPAPDTDDRLLSSPDFFNLPKPKIVRTYQNRRKLRAETQQQQEPVVTPTDTDNVELKKSVEQQPKSSENGQPSSDRQEVPECRRSNRQRVIKYEVRDLFNIKGSRNQSDTKSQRATNNALKTLKDSPRSELSSSPQTFRGFSDTDDPSSPIHFACRSLSRQSNATPTPPPQILNKDCGKLAKTNLAEKFSNASKLQNVFDKQEKETTEEEDIPLDTFLKSRGSHKLSLKSTVSKTGTKKDVKKPPRLLSRRKTILLNRSANESTSESTSDGTEAAKNSIEKSVTIECREFGHSASDLNSTTVSDDKAISESINNPKPEDITKPKISPAKAKKPKKTPEALIPCELPNEVTCNESKTPEDIKGKSSKNSASCSINQSELKSDDHLHIDSNIQEETKPASTDTNEKKFEKPLIDSDITTNSSNILQTSANTSSNFNEAESKDPKLDLTPKNSKKRGRPPKGSIQSPESSIQSPQTKSPLSTSIELSNDSSQSLQVKFDSPPEKQKQKKPRTPRQPKKSLSPKCTSPLVNVKSNLAANAMTSEIKVKEDFINESFVQSDGNENNKQKKSVSPKIRSAKIGVKSSIIPEDGKSTEIQVKKNFMDEGKSQNELLEDASNQTDTTIENLIDHNVQPATIQNVDASTVSDIQQPSITESSSVLPETLSDKAKTPDKKKVANKRPRTKGEMKQIEDNVESMKIGSKERPTKKSPKLLTSPKVKNKKKITTVQETEPATSSSKKEESMNSKTDNSSWQSTVENLKNDNLLLPLTQTTDQDNKAENLSEKSKTDPNNSPQSPSFDIDIKGIFDQARANISRLTLDACSSFDAFPAQDKPNNENLNTNENLDECISVEKTKTGLQTSDLPKAPDINQAPCKKIEVLNYQTKQPESIDDDTLLSKIKKSKSNQDMRRSKTSKKKPLLMSEGNSSGQSISTSSSTKLTDEGIVLASLDLQKQIEENSTTKNVTPQNKDFSNLKKKTKSKQAITSTKSSCNSKKKLFPVSGDETEQKATLSKIIQDKPVKIEKETKNELKKVENIKHGMVKENDSFTVEKQNKCTDKLPVIKNLDPNESSENEKSKVKTPKRKSKDAASSKEIKELSKSIKKKIQNKDGKSLDSKQKCDVNKLPLAAAQPSSYCVADTKNSQNNDSSLEDTEKRNEKNHLENEVLVDKKLSKSDFVKSETDKKSKSKSMDTKAKNAIKKDKTETKVGKEGEESISKKLKSKDEKPQTKPKKKRSGTETGLNEKLNIEAALSTTLSKVSKTEAEVNENQRNTSELQEAGPIKDECKSESATSSQTKDDTQKSPLENKSVPIAINPPISDSLAIESKSTESATSKKSTKSDETLLKDKLTTIASNVDPLMNISVKPKINDASNLNKSKQKSRISRWDQEQKKTVKATADKDPPTVIEKVKKPDEKITKLEPPIKSLENDKPPIGKRKKRSFSKSHSTSDGISDNYSSDSSDSRQTNRYSISLDTMIEPTSVQKFPPASNLSSVLNGLSSAVMNDLLEWTCNNKQTVLQIQDTIDLNQKSLSSVKSADEDEESAKVLDLPNNNSKDVLTKLSSANKDNTLDSIPKNKSDEKMELAVASNPTPMIQTSKDMLAELMNDSFDADTDHFSESSEASTKPEPIGNTERSKILETSLPSNVSDKTSELELSTRSSGSEPIDPNIRRSHRIKTQVKTTVGRGLVRDKSDRNQNSASALDLEAQNVKFLKDMEERLSQFQMIKENEYKCERIISREAKRMTCDCFLTRDEELRGELGCGEDCLNRLLMIECSGNCIVRDRCTNRRFQKNLYAPCKVFRTEKKGFGILADGEIGPGEFIMEYVGEVLNGKQFEKRAAIYSQDKNKHYYFMALRGDSIIDATMKGSISRFINHSCDPNAETQKWTVNGELRIGFFSKKRIFPGEEITFDYQFQRYGKEAQKCYCESANCRGWIGEEPESEDEEEVTSSESEEEIEDKPPEEILNKEQVKEIVPPLVESVPVPEDVTQPIDDIPKQTTTELPSTVEPTKEPEKIETPQKPTEKEISARKALKAAEKFARIAAKMKARKERERLKQQARMALEDPDLEAQISSLETTGLKNQPLTLKLSRCMVRAKYLQSKLRIFDILQKGEMACRRLFLDYHGLRLLHGWMSEIETTDVEQDLEFRQKTLETLDLLPIPNITILKDSKVFQVVQTWSDEMSQKILIEQKNENTEDKSPPNKKHKSGEENYLGIRKKIKTLCIKLIASWEVLPEVFRIPKRERIEQMKEHEREADRQYKALNLGDDDQYKTQLRNKERFGAKKSYKWIREKHEKRKEQALKDAEKGNNAEANLTKLQRRQLFAAKVAKDEAEKRLAEIRREIEFKCKFYGLDPRYMTPNTMPFCVHPPTGQWYSKEKKKIPTPPSHAHIKVPPKPQSTDPKDYKMPEMDLPPMWKFAMDPRGRLYYYHIKIRIPQWEPPIKILPLTSELTAAATTSTSNESEGSVIPALIDPQPSTSKQATLTAKPDASSSECGDTDSDISCSDIIGLNKGVPLQIGKDMIEQLKRSRKRKRFTRLVQERTISPRREEDRLYNQIEMRRYRENKEKIRRRKEEIKRRKALFRNGDDSSTNFKDNGMLLGPSTSKAALESLSIPIQDYLLSSDEDDLEKSDYNNSLIEKIVHGDKIVDELDAIAKEKPLKRPLPFLKDYLDKKRVKVDDNKKRTESSKSDKSSKSRKVESGSSKYVSRKAKEKFRIDIAGIIVHHLAPYRKDSCLIGKITNNEDFKHLARKLTHFVLVKELKHCDLTGQSLIVTESVKNKAREFIKKYMAKHGKVYVRPANDPEFRDIPH